MATCPNLTSLVATELSGDGGRTEVRSHGEVRNACGGQNNDRELMEETGSARPLWSVVSTSKVSKERKASTKTVANPARRALSPMIENTVHSQSEPLVEMCSVALGGLRCTAWLPPVIACSCQSEKRWK